MKGLNFNTLRKANLMRLPLFKNRKGEPAHSEPDGSDWSLNDWYTAMMGEAGELGSFLKQVRRGDVSLDEARADIAKELADVVTYADILAMRCGIDLGQVTWHKFNEISSRIHVDVFIDGETNLIHDGVNDLDL